MEEFVQFCSDLQEFSIFCADPTFKIFEYNIGLTVTMYKNSKSENKATNQPPVFIGPLLMHQHKDWKTYYRFANSLISEKMEFDSLLACGKDGEKALIYGFQLDLQHFCAVLVISKEKDRNLKSYSSTQHKLYM